MSSRCADCLQGLDDWAFRITSIISLRPTLLTDRLTRKRSRSKTLVKFVKDVPYYVAARRVRTWLGS